MIPSMMLINTSRCCVYVCVLLVCNVANIGCDIFSSSAHLQSVMFLERHLVATMTDYVSHMEARLEEIKRY